MSEAEHEVHEKVEQILHETTSEKKQINTASSLLAEILKPTPLPLHKNTVDNVLAQVLKTEEKEETEKDAVAAPTALPPLTAPSGMAGTATLSYIVGFTMDTHRKESARHFENDKTEIKIS